MDYDGCKWYIKNGYYSNGKIGKLSRYVYSKFFEIPDGYIIHHADCNILNDTIENLFCLTQSEHKTLHNTGKTGKLAYMYGKHQTKEAKKKMSKSKLGRLNPQYGKIGTNYGKSPSKETRLKLSNVNIIYKNGDIWQQKCGDWYIKENDKRRKLRLDEANYIKISHAKRN